MMKQRFPLEYRPFPSDAYSAAGTTQVDAEPPDAVIVVCVESGPLEQQTVWMVESLRRWGGSFSQLPVLAVTPRAGRSLAASTLDAFVELNVTWNRCKEHETYLWYGPLNKPAALAHAEQVRSESLIIWMDSDTLVVREPGQLDLAPGVDFVALPGSCVHDIGSNGLNQHENFWRSLFKSRGWDALDFPWIPRSEEGEGLMRMYWQSGVFAYRRSTCLGRAHLERNLELFDRGISSSAAGSYFHEQVALAFAVADLGLKWAVMQKSHNFPVNPLVDWGHDDIGFSDVRILHYFGSAWGEHFPALQQQVYRSLPSAGEWLAGKGALTDDRPLPVRVTERFRRQCRRLAEVNYSKHCQVA